MSTIYSGDGTVASASYTRKAIVDSTNATPIKVKVTAHGYADGDFVELAGHELNLNANGRWIIEYVDADHFNLVGSTPTAVGANTGYVICYAVHPRVTMPTDLVDDRDAASVNVMTEAAQDKIAYLYERVGARRLYDVQEAATSDDAWASWSTNAPGIFNTAAWAQVASGRIFSFASPPPVVNDGDWLEIWATMTVTTTGGVGLAGIGIGLVLDNMAGSPTLIAGSAQRLPGVNTSFHSLHLHAYKRISGGTNNRLWDIGIMGYGDVGAPQNVSFVGHRQVTVHHLRVNSG